LLASSLVGWGRILGIYLICSVQGTSGCYLPTENWFELKNTLSFSSLTTLNFQEQWESASLSPALKSIILNLKKKNSHDQSEIIINNLWRQCGQDLKSKLAGLSTTLITCWTCFSVVPSSTPRFTLVKNQLSCQSELLSLLCLFEIFLSFSLKGLAYAMLGNSV